MNTYGQQRYMESMSNMGQGLSHQSNLSHHSAASQRVKRVLESERCPKTGEIYSGYDVDSGEIVCNRCIFEKKLKNVKFIAQVSKELNLKYGDAFDDYSSNVESLSKINPEVAQENSEAVVRDFFNRLEGIIKALKQDTLVRIQKSDSLKQLEKILDGSREFFSVGGSTGRQDQFEKEKAAFDQKIQSGRYASIVKSQDYWNDLFKSLDSNSEKMTSTIQASTSMIQKVLRLEADEGYINEQLSSIAKDCLHIDTMTEVSSAQSSPAHSHQSAEEEAQKHREQLIQKQREAQLEAQRMAQAEAERQASIEREARAKQEAEKREAEREAERREAEKREAERAEAEEQQRREAAERRQQILEEAERQKRLRIEAEEREAARREEANLEDRDSHHSRDSVNSENSSSNQSSPTRQEKVASDSEEEDIGPPPTKPNLERPQIPPPFREPTMPQNLPPETLSQFTRFIELKRQKYNEQMNQVRRKIHEYNDAVKAYQEECAAYLKRKAAVEQRKEEIKVQREREQRQREEQAAKEEAIRQQEERLRLAKESREKAQREEEARQQALIQEQRRLREEQERQEEEARAEEERKRKEEAAAAAAAAAAAIPSCPEFTYKRLYKMKNDKIYTYDRSDSHWRQISDGRGVYMQKICYNLEGDRVYVLGGARDQKSKETLTDVRILKQVAGGYSQIPVAPMLDSRASFGCFFKHRGKEQIFVAGGYSLGSLSKKAEVYDVEANEWHRLPDMNVAKASSSLCMMNDRLLYCFGGLTRDERGHSALSSHVEVLDLQNPERWHQLPIQLLKSGCDLGCLPLNDSTIMIYGGWNRTSYSEVYLFTIARDAQKKLQHSITEVEEGSLLHADFFLSSGAALREGDNLLIGGHSKTHKYCLRSKKFVEV